MTLLTKETKSLARYHLNLISKLKNLDYETENQISDYEEQIKIKEEEKRQAEIAKKAKN